MKPHSTLSIPLICALSVAIVLFLGLLGKESRADSADLKKGSFSFVQMCDTQLGMGGYEHDVMTFNLA